MPERLPWFPQCHVYYSAKVVVVAAVQGDENHTWDVDGDPIKVLPLEACALDIGEAVIQSLAASHDRLKTYEAESQYASTPGRIDPTTY